MPGRRGAIHSVPASSASARSLAASSEGKGDASVVSLPSTSTASHQPSSSAPIRYSRLSLQACSAGLNEAATEPVCFVTTSDQWPWVSAVHVNATGCGKGGWGLRAAEAGAGSTIQGG